MLERNKMWFLQDSAPPHAIAVRNFFSSVIFIVLCRDNNRCTHAVAKTTVKVYEDIQVMNKHTEQSLLGLQD